MSHGLLQHLSGGPSPELLQPDLEESNSPSTLSSGIWKREIWKWVRLLSCKRPVLHEELDWPKEHQHSQTIYKPSPNTKYNSYCLLKFHSVVGIMLNDSQIISHLISHGYLMGSIVIPISQMKTCKVAED